MRAYTKFPFVGLYLLAAVVVLLSAASPCGTAGEEQGEYGLQRSDESPPLECGRHHPARLYSVVTVHNAHAYPVVYFLRYSRHGPRAYVAPPHGWVCHWSTCGERGFTIRTSSGEHWVPANQVWLAHRPRASQGTPYWIDP